MGGEGVWLIRCRVQMYKSVGFRVLWCRVLWFMGLRVQAFERRVEGLRASAMWDVAVEVSSQSRTLNPPKP